ERSDPDAPVSSSRRSSASRSTIGGEDENASAIFVNCATIRASWDIEANLSRTRARAPSAQRQRHEHAVGIRFIGTEWSAAAEPEAFVQALRREEVFVRARFEAEARIAAR